MSASSTNNIVVGIDSDTKGSIAVLDWDGGRLDVYKFPHRQVEIGGTMRPRIDEAATASLIKAVLDTHNPSLVLVEEQWARQGQGVTSSFTFGDVYGFCKGAVLGANPSARLHLVTGAVWKTAFSLTRNHLNITDTGNKGRKLLKAAARTYATKLFPNHGPFWTKEAYTSAAEASLIALYGLLCVLNYKPDKKTIVPSGQSMGAITEITTGKHGRPSARRNKT